MNLKTLLNFAVIEQENLDRQGLKLRYRVVNFIKDYI